jgi:hypothetical protein
MTDYIAQFAHWYIDEDDSPTEEEMQVRLSLAEYYLDIPFDADGNTKLQYHDLCETCFKRWDSRPVTD